MPAVRLLFPVELVGSSHQARLDVLAGLLHGTDHRTDPARWDAIYDLYLIESAYESGRNA